MSLMPAVQKLILSKVEKTTPSYGHGIAAVFFYANITRWSNMIPSLIRGTRVGCARPDRSQKSEKDRHQFLARIEVRLSWLASAMFSSTQNHRIGLVKTVVVPGRHCMGMYGSRGHRATLQTLNPPKKLTFLRPVYYRLLPAPSRASSQRSSVQIEVQHSTSGNPSHALCRMVDFCQQDVQTAQGKLDHIRCVPRPHLSK